MSFKLLHLSSKDRATNEESYDMVFNIKDGISGAKSLQIVDIVFPHTMYTFNEGANKLYFREESHPGDLLECSFPTNVVCWDFQMLCDLVASALSSTAGAVNSYKVIWLDTFNKLRIYTTNHGLHGFKILNDVELQNMGYDVKTLANDYIGFSQAFDFTNSVMGAGMPYLFDPAIFMSCDLITSQTYTSDNRRDILMKINIDKNFGGWIFNYGFLTDNKIPINTDSFNGFKITTTGVRGNYINLNGLDFYFLIKLNY